MKLVRWSGLLAGAVVALLLLAALGLHLLFDGEKIKAEMTRQVKAKTQRELVIDGPLQLSLWPNLGVVLGKTSLSEAGDRREFLSLDSARVSVAVLPLLAKQIVVKGVAADGLRVRVVKHQDGTLSTDDLSRLGGAEAARDEKVGAGKTAIRVLKVADVAFTHADVTWRDEQTGRSLSISGLDLMAGPVALDMQQKTLQLDAVAFKNKQFFLRNEKTGGVTGLSDVSVAVRHVAADAARQALAVEQLSLRTQGRLNDQRFALDLAAPQLNVTPEQVTGGTLQLALQWAGGGRQTTARMTLSGITGSLRQVAVARLALDADSTSELAAHTGAVVKAKLVSPVSLNLAEQMLALPKVTGTLAVSSPGMVVKKVDLPINGRARLNWEKKNAAVALATQLDGANVFLDAQATQFSPLALRGILRADRLNVDKYFPPGPAVARADEGKSAKDAKDANSAGGKAHRGDAPLDFSALRGVNLQGEVHIAALQVNRLKFAQFRAGLKAANDRLLVAPWQANLYGGTMDGRLLLNAQDNGITLKQSLLGVQVHPLLMDLANQDVLSGTGSIMLDVSGRGLSVDALKKSLAGTLSLNLRDGAVKGINLAQSLRDAKRGLALARGSVPDVIQVSRKEEKTDFSALTASFHINNGVAHNNDLSVLSPFLRITGEGDIDIGRNQINYLAKARVVNTSTGQDGRAVDQVAGVTVPVRVTGPVDKITWKIEFAQAVGELLKEKTQTRVEEKRQEMKQKLNDQLQEKLKGLLQR
jgi:AsmA protein